MSTLFVSFGPKYLPAFRGLVLRGFPCDPASGLVDIPVAVVRVKLSTHPNEHLIYSLAKFRIPYERLAANATLAPYGHAAFHV
jgi:hypothetical protein